MTAKVLCPNSDCRKSYQVAKEKLGKQGRCKECGTRFTFAAAGKTAAPVVTQAEPNAASATPTNDKVKRLGRFEIRGRLGSGAFGTVFRAHDPQLDREVALKVPHAARLGNPRFVKRFLNEAKLAARLQHPNIVPVFDAGKDGKRYYIASAFIEGGTLDAALGKQTLDFRETARIVMQLAEALAYAHKQDIIHRDVKPDNVMLDGNGEPHLMDFGLARLETSDEKLTQGGGILGTPAYKSPEQASGDQQESDDVTATSDQYSLGVTLYELLCGELPFNGPPDVVIFNVIQTEPPTPRSINADIPPDLDTICLKAMAKEPQRRYSDCVAFADDLQRWLDDEPIQARHLTPLERAQRWCRRNPVMAGLAGLSAALLVLVALVSAVGYASTSAALADANIQRKKAKQEQEKAEVQATIADEKTRIANRESREAQQERDRARDASRRAQIGFHAAQMNLVQRDWEDAQITSLLGRLEKTRGDDVRGFEWGYWDRLVHGDLLTFNGHPGVSSVVFSPDGTRIVSAGDGWVKVWDAATGQESLTLRELLAGNMAFSPDATRLVSTRYDSTAKLWTVRVRDAATGRETLTFEGHAKSVSSVTFSPDGTRLASASSDGTVKLWNTATGTETLTLEGHKNRVADVSFSPDGTRLASASADRTVKLWEVATGQETLTLKGHTKGVSSVVFSLDGTRLASASSDNTVKLWDAATGQEPLTLKGHYNVVKSVAFSSDGTRLASAGRDTKVNLWNAATGQRTLTLKGDTKEANSVSFSPDGTRLAYSSGNLFVQTPGEVHVWDVAAEQETLTLKGHTEGVSSVVFSPDGTRLASASADRTVKVWDAATGAEMLTLEGHKNCVADVSFSPDGTRLASASWDETVKVWNAATGQETLTLKGHSKGVNSVAFSPDGTLLASASDDNTVKVWNAATGQEILTLKGHTDHVHNVAFSPDGTRLASASEDKTVKLWDAATGAETLTLKGHLVDFNSIAFSPDGMRLASGSGNGPVKVWDARPWTPQLKARQILNFRR
ncbi:MAG: protein kinase [Planctomycetaceae bacterium]|nr:protein kinase [Planctomycetaceae bacterium]